MSDFIFNHTVVKSDGLPVPANTSVAIETVSGTPLQPRDLSGAAIDLRTGELGSLPNWSTAEETARAYAVIGGHKNPVISEDVWDLVDAIPALQAAVAELTAHGTGSTLPAGTIPVYAVKQSSDKSWPASPPAGAYLVALFPVPGQTTVTPPTWYEPSRCVWFGTTAVVTPPSTPTDPGPGTGTGTGSTSPTALTVVKGSDYTTATASWTAAGSPAAGWRIDVTGTLSGGATAWANPQPIPGTARSATVPGLLASSTYVIKVTSLDDGTSVSKSYTTPASGALLLTASATDAGVINLVWEYPSDPAAGWLYGRDGTDTGGFGSWQTETPVAGSLRSGTLAFLVPGATYNVWVQKADDPAVKATASATIPASTTPAPGGGGTPAPATGLGVAAAKLWNQALSGDSPIHSGIWAGSDAPGCTVTGHANRVIGMQTWRGRKSATVMCFGQAGNAMNTGAVGTYLNKPELAGAKMIARIMVRDSVGQRTLAQCATGASDGIFQAWANALKNAGYLDPLIGIGWEAQGNWTPNWISGGAGNRYEDYAAVVARARTVIKAILPNARIGIEFLLGNGPLPGYTDASMIAAMCTGTGADAWVMDTYDFYNTAAVTDAEWNSNILSRLTPLAASCRQTGMVITRTEWNITTPDTAGFEGGSSNGGHGDNVFYIRKFHEWDLANTDVMALECIFAEGGSGQNRGFWDPVQNPLCSAYYKSKFGTTYAV